MPETLRKGSPAHIGKKITCLSCRTIIRLTRTDPAPEPKRSITAPSGRYLYYDYPCEQCGRTTEQRDWHRDDG